MAATKREVHTLPGTPVSETERRGQRICVQELGLPDLDLLMEWRARVLADVFADSFAEGSADNPTDSPDDSPLPDRDWATLLEANKAYYQRELPAGGHRAFMVFADGTPVACGAVCLQREMPSPDNPTGRCAYVMNVYTVPERRGMGLAGLVMRTVLDAAAQARAHKVYLETTQAGRPLYERLGFEDMEGYLHLPHETAAAACDAALREAPACDAALREAPACDAAEVGAANGEAAACETPGGNQ